MVRKGKFVPVICVVSGQSESLPLPEWKVPSVISLQCLVDLFEGMCHTGGSALVSIADKLDNLLWQLARSTLVRGSVLLGPRIASVPATMATLSIVPALR